ncbi:MAG: hypothetical protein WC728_03795 [Elusimicrobiota bacterium]
MGALVSGLSILITGTPPIRYTTPFLVSRRTGGVVPEQEILAEWIAEAREEIDKYTGLCFATTRQTDFLDGEGKDVVFLTCFPVLEILGIWVDEELFEEPSGGRLRKVKLNKRTGSLMRIDGLVWPKGYENIEVRYIYGYRAVPPLVQKVATLIVAKTALSAKKGPLEDSERIGNWSASYSLRKLDDELDRAWAALGKRRPMYFA